MLLIEQSRRLQKAVRDGGSDMLFVVEPQFEYLSACKEILGVQIGF